MSVPELWTRCPSCGGDGYSKRTSYTGANPPGCARCMGGGLVRVPFDQAVERMLDGWYVRPVRTPMGDKKRAEKRVLCERLLRAALGEDT